MTLPSLVTALLTMILIMRQRVTVLSSIFLQRMRGSYILQQSRMVRVWSPSVITSSPLWEVLLETSSGKEATMMLVVTPGLTTTLMSFLQSLVPSRRRKNPESMARGDSLRLMNATLRVLLKGSDIYPYWPGSMVPRLSCVGNFISDFVFMGRYVCGGVWGGARSSLYKLKMMGFINKILDWIKGKFFSKELEIAIVGLQNAGKTTLVKAITDGTYDQDTIPTIGFNHHEIKKGKISMKLWDLGGQAKFRDSWEKFCRDSDVIIFVVDSYDQTNIDVARAQLHDLLSNKSLAGIPLLVLGNKNDLQGALKQAEIISRMDLTALKDRTVATFSISAKSQNRLDVALKWLSDLKPKK